MRGLRICLLVLLLLSGIVSVKAQATIEYQFNDEFGGDFVASGFSSDETTFYIALPFRLEFYDLTGSEITLLDSISLPGIKAVTENSNLLAVTHRSKDRTRYEVSLIDLTTRTITHPGLIQDVGVVTEMAFSPDNMHLAILGFRENYSRLFIVELANPDNVSIYTAAQEFSQLSNLEWSADGRYIATLDKGLVVFDKVTDQVSFETDIYMGDSSIALYDNQFLIYNTRQEIFWFYDLTTASLSTYEIERQNPNWAFSWRFTPDYQYIAGREGMTRFVYPVPAEPGLIAVSSALSEIEAEAITHPERSEHAELNALKILNVVGHQVFEVTTSPGGQYEAYRFLVIEADIYSAYKQQIAIITQAEIIEEIRVIDRIFTPEIGGIYQANGDLITVTGSCGVLNVDFSGAAQAADFITGCGDVYNTICGLVGEKFMATSEFCYTEPGDYGDLSPDIMLTRLNDKGEPTDEQLLLRGHTGGLTGFSFSVDEKRLLTRSADNTVRLWSFLNTEGELELTDVQVFGDGIPLNAATFNADSSLVATGDFTGQVKIYDVNPASTTYTQLLQTLDTFSDGVSTAFSGDYLYTVSGGRIIQWKKS